MTPEEFREFTRKCEEEQKKGKVHFWVDCASGKDKSIVNGIIIEEEQIFISKKTEDRLKKLCKENKSYDEIINILIDLLEGKDIQHVYRMIYG